MEILLSTKNFINKNPEIIIPASIIGLIARAFIPTSTLILKIISVATAIFFSGLFAYSVDRVLFGVVSSR